MNFTDYYELGILSHQEIDFIDIRLDTDVPFFLDAERIALCSHPIAPRAASLIEDYFETLFTAATQKDSHKLLRLLSFGREPNETHLGLSIARSCGKGSSPDILLPIIQEMIRLNLFDVGLITQLNDLQLWTPNFGPDRLSDLTTNIIRSVLFDYTLQQFQLLGIPAPTGTCTAAATWDPMSHDWIISPFPDLRAGPYPVLLVPKQFVGLRLLSSPGELLQKYALTYRQQEHLNQLTPLCHRKVDKRGKESWSSPTKDELKSHELKGTSEKKYMLDIGYRHPGMVREMHWDHQHRHMGYIEPISDRKLDAILYADKHVAI